MAINFANPTTTRNYSTEFTQDIKDNIIALSQLLDSANTTITGTPPTYSKRINRSSGLFEEYNSTAWVSFTMGYLKVAGDTMTGVLTNTAASTTGITLTRASGNTVGLQIGQTGVISWNIQNQATTGVLSFNTGGSDIFKITTAGAATFNGTTAGISLLTNGLAEIFQLKGGVRGTGNLYATFNDATGRKAYYGFGGGDDTFYFSNELNAGMMWYTNATQRMILGAAGNFTLNSPASGITELIKSSFEANSVVTAWWNGNTAANQAGLRFNGAITRFGSERSDGSLQLTYGSSVTGINISNSGAVSVANTLLIPDGNVLAWGDASTYITGSGATDIFSIYTAATQRYTISATGNHSLLPASTGTTFTITSSGSAYALIIQNAASQGALLLNGTNAGGIYTEWQSSGTSRGFIGCGSSLLTVGGLSDFIIRAETSLRFATGGNVLVGTINSTGNWNIPQPSGGSVATLEITAPTTSHGIKINSTDNYYAINVTGGGTINVGLYTYNAGSSAYFGTISGHDFKILSNATTRINLGSAGLITMYGGAYTDRGSVTWASGGSTIDCRLSNYFYSSSNANMTTAPTLSNPGQGQTINWEILSGGAYTIVWPTSFKWPGGTVPTLSTTAGKYDLLVATWNGSYWLASLLKGF
jgi:hypothetical protein